MSPAGRAETDDLTRALRDGETDCAHFYGASGLDNPDVLWRLLVFRDDSIAGSWRDLADRLDARHALTAWARSEAALGDLTCLDQLVELTAHGCDPRRADALIGALVRTAAVDGGGDSDAALVVVHLLSQGVLALATRLVDVITDPTALIVGELTVQIRDYPVGRRTRAFAANVLLDTQAALWRELLPHRTRTFRDRVEIAVDPLDRPGGRSLIDTDVPGPGEDEDIDVLDLLLWATRTHVVDPEEVTLLVELERCWRYGAGSRQQVAKRLQIPERTLRRRRDRALAALRAACPDYLGTAA
jgi:hypothetical protein